MTLDATGAGALTPGRWASSRTSAGRLEVSELAAGYGRLTVLRDISFEVRPGEVLGIGGPNGAGKTTLLNAVAGLSRQCSGRVSVDGTVLSRSPAYARVADGLVLVPEGRQIIGSITVRANLDLTLMARRRLRVDREHLARLERVLDLFPPLRARLSAPGRVLSGGEQQMLAIGRALMAWPRVLLLDEPSQGLAPEAVATVLEALAQLKGSVSMVLVEQAPQVLDALADRVLTLTMGRFADG